VGRKRQEIVLRGHLQVCTRCGARGREPIPFAKGKAKHIMAFARLVVDLCGITTIRNVARYLGVGWDLVKDLFKAELGCRLKRRKLGRIRFIAVDEFATHKGHKYMTVALDLETGEILHAQEGKDAGALVAFLETLKRRKAPLEAIAMDMSGAYAGAVRAVFDDRLDIVHDPFHVTALASKAIDETRRDLYHQLQGEEKKVVKGTQFLLLHGLKNLKACRGRLPYVWLPPGSHACVASPWRRAQGRASEGAAGPRRPLCGRWADPEGVGLTPRNARRLEARTGARG